MKQNRWAAFSVGVLVLGWVWVGLFLASHMNARYAGQWWVQAAAFLSYVFSPIAAIFGIAGLLFERPKSAGLLAMLLSLASAALVFWVRP